MQLEAKIVTKGQPLSSVRTIGVSDSVAVAPGGEIALNLQADAVSAYVRDGADLVIQLTSGETVRLVDFYALPAQPARLFLVDEEGRLLEAELSGDSAASQLTARYTPQDVSAGFVSETAAAETAASTAVQGTTGGFGAAGIGGGLALAGGVALAVGGGDDDKTPASPPAAATEVLVSADGRTVTGRAEPGATVQIDTNGDGAPDHTGLVDASGRFSIALPTPLLDGQTLSIRVTNEAGSSPAVTVTAPDTTPPAAATEVVVSADGTTVTGRATPGTTVRIDVNGDGTSDYTGAVDGSGRFSIVLSPPLIDGQTVSVRVADTAGNASSPVTALAPDLVPTPAPPTVDLTNGQTVTGSAGPDLQIRLYDGDGVLLGEGRSDINGDWSIVPNSPIPHETEIRVVAVNSEGQASAAATAVVDAVGPDLPEILVANASLISGLAEPGATVTVYIGASVIGSVVADENGAWSIPTPAGTTDGAPIGVIATDPAGNDSLTASTAIDTAPPGAPTLAVSNGVLLTGSAEPDGTVTLSTADGGVLATVAVDSLGNWAYAPNPPLADGAVVTAVATDTAGNTGAAADLTISTTPPSTPQLSPTDGDVIRGVADPDAVVTLTLVGPGGETLLAQVFADANGFWSFDAPGSLTNGTVVQAVASDAAGNLSGVAAIQIDSVPPSIPVVLPSNGLEFTGAAEPGAAIVVTGPGGVLGTTVADSAGNWFVTPSAGVANGDAISVVATDSSGNFSPAAIIIADTIPPIQPVLSQTNGNVIVGVTEGYAWVAISIAGQPDQVVRADAQGNFSFTPASPLPDNTLIEAVARDAAGNPSLVGQVLSDTSLPTIPTIDPSNGVALTGFADPNVIIILSVGGTEIGRTATNINGQWAFVFATPVGDGVVFNAVAQVPPAGNVSGAFTVITDAVPPAPPILDPSNGAVVTGTAEIGSTVLLYNGSNVLIGTAVADASGRWSVTPGSSLADGTQLVARVRDAALNVSLDGNGVVDAAPPAAPVLTTSNGVTVSGTAEANAVITLTLTDGTIVGSTTADSSGNWSAVLTAVQADGVTLFATARDVAGNDGVSASLTVDAAPPGAPTVDASDGATLVGTGEIGATITISIGAGLPVGTAVVDANGDWSFTPGAPFADGAALLIRAVDASGNIGEAVGLVIGAAATAPLMTAASYTGEGDGAADAAFLLADHDTSIATHDLDTVGISSGIETDPVGFGSIPSFDPVRHDFKDVVTWSVPRLSATEIDMATDAEDAVLTFADAERGGAGLAGEFRIPGAAFDPPAHYDHGFVSPMPLAQDDGVIFVE